MGGELFPGGGRSGELVRAHEWSKTALGPMSTWPAALKLYVRTLLACRFPMQVWWGPELLHFHNDAFVPSMGPRSESAIGRSAREIWLDVWPVVGASLERVYANGESFGFENVLVPIERDGKLTDAWWTYSYSPAYDDDGEIAGILIVCSETTTQHARTEVLSVFQQAPIPIAVLQGPEHVYTLANPAYDSMVGRRALGKKVLEAFTHEEVGNFVPILDRVYRTGETERVHEAELHLVDEHGVVQDQFIDATYQPYRAPDGAIRGVMAFHNDITLAVAARREAEALSRARDEFLAMLGHELRNPLAPIATATTLMKLRGDHAPKEREIIERQVAHLTRLVDDLLDVSRVARGRIEMRREPVRIAEVLEAARETVAPLVDAPRRELTLHVTDEHGLLVEGDSIRLAQVFTNILTNAAKYTPPGGHIEVRAWRDGERVFVKVSDDGPGFPTDLLPRIFEMFVQGQQSIDRAQGGLGLGLALVRNLVILHHGTVTATNRAGGGAEVLVELPLFGPAGASESIASERPAAASEAKAKRRILLVDDNQDHVDLLAAFLERIGHAVETAYDGDAALEKLRSFDAEVALLDIGLPGMDGYELARRIRRDAPGVKTAIAVTGYGQPRDREATKAAGFDHHLTKPVNLEDLARLIEASGS